MKTFLFDVFTDDPQNKRTLFQNTETDRVMTIYYDDIAWMLTSPYNG